jgi:hypothetical protein
MAGRIAYYGGIVKDGLILDLDAAKKDSYIGTGNTWRDISGNGFTGTLTTGATFNSGNGGIINFNGTTGTVNCGNILNIGLNSWTISCWVKINVGTGVVGIFGKSSARGYVGRYSIYLESNNINTLFQPSASTYVISTSITPYLDGKFHNITATINRTGFHTLYIDAVSVGAPNNISSTSNINLSGSTDNIYIGSYADSTGIVPLYFLNGSIPQASIYNRAISSTEVLQNYNATKGRFGL